MISVLYSEGRNFPLVVCDQCGEAIKNAELGMVAFGETREEGKYQELAFLHKGQCDKTFKEGEKRPGGWMELSHFLARLCHNAGTGGENFVKASKGAAELERF